MPIYTHLCPVCAFEDEIIRPVARRDDEVMCSHCRVVMPRKLTLPAKTATLWEGGWRSGLGSNKYSVALGQKVSSKRQEERLMKERGFIPESDLGTEYISNFQSKMAETEAADVARADRYIMELEKHDGDKIKAMTEAFPAQECLAQDD